MNDTSDAKSQYRQQRLVMVEQQLRARGIRDARVLSAMAEIPRHFFVPANRTHLAYDDCAIPIGQHQTISQPYIVAFMTELLNIRPTDRVLEIGTGSGYQTAILATLARQVFTVERIESLSNTASSKLKALQLEGVIFVTGDGSLGLPNEAPFDRIMVTAAAPTVPTALTEQLTEGGILVLPVGVATKQVVSRVIKQVGRTVESPRLPCRFVKLIGQQGWPSP